MLFSAKLCVLVCDLISISKEHGIYLFQSLGKNFGEKYGLF